MDGLPVGGGDRLIKIDRLPHKDILGRVIGHPIVHAEALRLDIEFIGSIEPLRAGKIRLLDTAYAFSSGPPYRGNLHRKQHCFPIGWILLPRNMTASTVPETCAYCPHLDEFHSNCSHPLNQSIIRELGNGSTDCPVFAEIRAGKMRDLEDRISDDGILE